MHRKILYFINPISGTQRKELLQKIITEKTKEKKIPFSIIQTSADDNYSSLSEKIKKENFTDVVICGGDGTINLIASALINTNVQIGIIPSGSGNGLSLSAKIPRQPHKALEVIFNNRSSFIDAFYINKKLSCMLCGLGLDAQVAHDFAMQKKRGLSTYIQQSLKNFIKAAPYTFEITANDETFSTDAFFISIANSNQFGNNFKIAPKALLSDGLLDIIIVKKMNKIKLMWAILKQIRAGAIIESKAINFHKKEILYFQTDALTITNLSNAPLHIDGDPAETSKKFSIKILRNALKLLQP